MSDQEDFESLSRRLAETDFSADSRVRASLRARLLGRGRAPRLSPARVASLALAFAAAALILLFPLRAKLHRAEENRIASQVRLPAAPSRTSPLEARLQRNRTTSFPRGELGLPVLPGVLAATGSTRTESPLSSRAIDHLIEVHRGRTVLLKGGSAVVWEIDGTAYGLETRRITLDDIFVTRPL